MEDEIKGPNSPNHGLERTEAVRSRWTPKPEQILILESIFNSGMVNPPKDETVRIRKLLEKFGCVGDANVFYWFQNRRSRSRRRQRQIQANLSGEQAPVGHTPSLHGGAVQYAMPSSSSSSSSSSFPSYSYGGSSSASSVANPRDDFPFTAQISLPEFDHKSAIIPSPVLCSPDTCNLQYHSGLITVFVNGIRTEVPRGPLDMKTMFGQDLVLMHSSGLPIPFNEYGFSTQSLQHGESYFLVSRTT